MRQLLPFISLLMLDNRVSRSSIAPNIEDYKITKGKDFKRSLPKREMFIFEDPKEAGHFYTYVNTKFNLDEERVLRCTFLYRRPSVFFLVL